MIDYIDYFSNINCPHCHGQPEQYKRQNASEHNKILELNCANKCFNRCYLKLILIDNDIDFLAFFLYKNSSNGFAFNKDLIFRAEWLFNLEIDQMISLIENYAKDCNIKKLQEKYETLVLFK